jgi:aryl-phospho-beta-D-glucosidase BglC (GH1 family)
MLTMSLPSLLSDLNKYNDNSTSTVMVYGEKYKMRNVDKDTNSIPFMGVNMRGLYTSLQHDTNRYTNAPFPVDYYEDSFKLISQAGMNHVRYVFYWEAYENNPSLFMKELSVAKTVDKYGLNIL